MSAEDLDKLFRDKLQNKPVTPRNEAWERLQARMQAPAAQEALNPFLVPTATEQKEERAPIRMWYYSAAAAVTMLLSVGLWVSRDNINPLQPSDSIAKVTDSKNAPAMTSTPSQEAAPVQAESETVYTYPAAPARTEAIAAVKPASSPQAQTARATEESAVGLLMNSKQQQVPKAPVNVQEPEMMASATPVKALEDKKSNSSGAELEITIKLDNAQATSTLAQASTKETDTPQEEEQSGSGRVLKGILKQVKHLKDGEKVNLSELGISKHTYALETNIGNKKITKTIEL